MAFHFVGLSEGLQVRGQKLKPRLTNEPPKQKPLDPFYWCGMLMRLLILNPACFIRQGQKPPRTPDCPYHPIAKDASPSSQSSLSYPMSAFLGGDSTPFTNPCSSVLYLHNPCTMSFRGLSAFSPLSSTILPERETGRGTIKFLDIFS